MDPIATTIAVATYVADKLAAKYIQKVPDILFHIKTEKLKQRLGDIIYKTIDEFEKHHAIDEVGSQYPFYKSQILVDSLLNYSCFGEGVKNLEEVFKSAEHVITPTADQLSSFMAMFHKNIREDSQLRDLEIEAKYKELIFDISQKLDALLHGLEMSKIITSSEPQLKYVNKAPYFNVNDLIGREECLQKLHKKIMANPSLRLIIHGIPGVGKTSLLLAYINSDTFTREFDHIAWITATSNIRSSMVLQFSSSDLGFVYDINNSMQWNFNMLISRMRHISGRNLLIIDNANDPDEILSFLEDLGQLRWIVVITTRAFIDYCDSIELQDISFESAKSLFYRFYKKDRDDENLRQLLTLINNNALLTELLAKVSNKNPGLNIASLKNVFAEKSISAPELSVKIPIGKHAYISNLFREQRINEYLLALFQVEGLTDEEKSYLRYLSLIPTTGIHVRKFFELLAIDKSREIFFLDSINELIKKGWVQEKSGTIKSHYLIQTVVREKLGVTAQLCLPLIVSIKYLLYVQPGDNALKKIEYLELGKNILKYVQDDHDEIGSLANNVSVLLRTLGDRESSIQYCSRALNIRKICGDRDLLAQSYNNLGTLLRELDRYVEAENAIRKAIELYSMSGPSPELANALSNLGSTLHEKGEFKEALAHENKAVRIMESKCDPLDPQLSWVYCTIAQTYRACKDYKMALKFALKDLNIAQAILEPDHPELAVTYQNLSEIYHELKMHKEAMTYAEKSLSIREQIYDFPHSDLAMSYNQIGVILLAMDKLEQAGQYEIEAADILEKLSPRDNKGLLMVYSVLTNIFLRMKDLKRTRMYLGKSVEILNTHPHIFSKNFASRVNELKKEIEDLYSRVDRATLKKRGFKV